MDNKSIESSSFRDPSGIVFYDGDEVYRQVNRFYQKQYDQMNSSGLYGVFMKKKMMIPHREVDVDFVSEQGYKVIKPAKIPFISYPYEWGFGQLKDAALLTLNLHYEALQKGMILKDASAYNIQFLSGSAILIDTLSFDFYNEGDPWIAYGQFCRHFLAPLFLMVYVDLRLNQLLKDYIDGIPLDLAAKLLRRRGGFAATQHIRWHAKSTQKYSSDSDMRAAKSQTISLGKNQQLALVSSMIRIVENLKLRDAETQWGDYDRLTSYSEDGADEKKEIVSSFLSEIEPKLTWDLGANDGTYSRLAITQPKTHVVAFDMDFVAVEKNYFMAKKNKENILPLLLDISNPSPGIGFANDERKPIGDRERPDCIIMLAVIHHLAITNNLPLVKVARWLASLTDNLIIEFVPKEDTQVQTLLATRDDIFPEYTQECFEKDFKKCFEIVEKKSISGSERTLYYMEKKVR